MIRFLAGFTDTVLALWKFDRTTHTLSAQRSIVQLAVKQDESDQRKYHQNAREEKSLYVSGKHIASLSEVRTTPSLGGLSWNFSPAKKVTPR